MTCSRSLSKQTMKPSQGLIPVSFFFFKSRSLSHHFVTLYFSLYIHVTNYFSWSVLETGMLWVSNFFCPRRNLIFLCDMIVFISACGERDREGARKRGFNANGFGKNVTMWYNCEDNRSAWNTAVQMKWFRRTMCSLLFLHKLSSPGSCWNNLY